ncbi:MAG: hypothetical protein DMG73_17735 [Acidobacteria bacterium]|nr:MAG: hypothetical protein DMG73_17735 [Acidobacteriota bacterium]PYX64109.1 MAG: hypothetical protein DMG74_14255 [Acidobacteriota bacterium]
MGRILNALLGPVILLLTVVTAVALGILTTYAVVNTILSTFAQQSREPAGAPVLIEHHASGD